MSYKVRFRVVILSVISVIMLGICAPAYSVHAASGDTTVYLTKTGECYHSDGCSSLSRSKIPTTLQDAVNRNFRACSKCNPGLLDTATTTTVTSQAATSPTTVAPQATTSPATVTPQSTTAPVAVTTTTMASSAIDPIEALKTYKGNNTEFNAYVYYVNNIDLQTAIGPDGDKLLKHYTDFGKAEGRKAK